MLRLKLSSSAIVLAMIASASASALAQEGAPAEPVDDTSTMKTVYVTATKRDESAQDIPIAVNVVDGELIADKGVGSLLQIESIAPGVQLVRSPTGKSSTGVTIRGLGSSPGTTLFESSVSLFVDGVYAPRSREFTSALFDIERIEVIKGTQAALLGKNTSAGAINVIPRKPGDDFAAELTASHEFELGSTTILGATDLPLSDKLKLRLSAQMTDQAGWTENIISGEKATEMEDFSLRGVLVYEPNSDTDFTLLVQTSDTDLSGTPAEVVISSPIANMLQAADGYPGSIDGTLNRRNSNGLTSPGEPAGESLNNDKAQLTANFDLNGFILTSVTGWSAYQSDGTVDGDGLAGNYLTGEDNEKSSQFLQEVRLVSPAGETFDYIVGGMYLDNLLKETSQTAANYPFGPAPGVNIAGAYAGQYNQTTEAWSAFAQGTYRFTDKIRGIAGLRYTAEDKEFLASRTLLSPGLYSIVLFPPVAPVSQARSEENFDYSAGLQYDVSDDTMVYVSYGKGTKAGGFSDQVADLSDSDFDSETAKTLELGLKSSGRNWQLNAAAFSTDIEGFQVVTFNGQQFVISNTDLESNGVEAEGFWEATENLRLMANTTYAKARNAITGDRIPNAPDWTGSIGFDYDHALGESFMLTSNGSVDWRSEVTYQQDPNAAVRGEAFTTLNASVGIADADGAWELSLIGQNLTDENSASFAYPTPFVQASSATSEMPRTIALQLRLWR